MMVKHSALWFTGILFGLLIMLAISVTAQEGGQFCLRAFEDRNGNGIRDAGEPAITSGVAAILTDANNVIRNSANMADSATAGQGVLCFLGLEDRQYTMLVTSADFAATTSDSLIVNVVAGEQPPVLDYGGQRIEPEPLVTVAETDSGEEALIERAVVAGSVASVVMFVMALIGLLIYAILLRNRRPAYPQYPPDAMYRRPPPTSTGQMPPVPPQDTGRYPPQE